MIVADVRVDLLDFKARAIEYRRTLLVECRGAATQGGGAVAAQAISEPNFRNRTGRLLSSIKAQSAKPDGRDRYIAEVRASTPYAAHVEYGTRAHVIRARRARNLRFFWERSNTWFIGKKVNHPGSQGRFYMSRGARHAYYVMKRRLDDYSRQKQFARSVWAR
jgi:hypothetical protein